MKYKYSVWVKDHGGSIENAESFETPHDDLSYVAEEYAEHYHDNRDGWECSWPITFSIARDGKHLGDFSVERESRPYFSAIKVKP